MKISSEFKNLAQIPKSVRSELPLFNFAKSMLLCKILEGNMLLPTAGHLERTDQIMAIDYEKMGKRIKQRREVLNISQEQLGASLLTSNVHISNIENGSRAPSLDLFVAIANALEVSADDLLANSLTVSSSPVGQELHALLQDCNHDEIEMLTRLLKFMKALFLEFGI